MGMQNREIVSKAFAVVLCLGCMTLNAAVSSAGVLSRAGKTSQQALESFGTVTSADVGRVITKYGSYGQTITDQKQPALSSDFKKSSFLNILQERALLLEAFFVHLGLLTGSRVFAGIDQTDQAGFSVDAIMHAGLAKGEIQETVSKSTTLAQGCSSLFTAHRYMRGLGLVIDKKGLPLLPLDTFYGVVVVNTGWHGSYQMPQKYDEKTGSADQATYWIKSGVQIVSGDTTVFLEPLAAGVAQVSGGVDKGEKKDASRSFSFVMTDEQGSAALSSTQQPLGITVAADSAGIPVIKVNGEVLTASAATNSFFAANGTLPWALFVSISNPKGASGASLQPVVSVQGLIQLNPKDFPLRYQPDKEMGGYSPFTTESMFGGFEIFKQQVKSIPPFVGNTLERAFGFGECKEVTMHLSLSTTGQNGDSIQPLATASAKLQGALSYSWSTQYSIAQALSGMDVVIDTLGIKKTDITARTLYGFMIGTIKQNGQDVPVAPRPEVLIFNQKSNDAKGTL